MTYNYNTRIVLKNKNKKNLGSIWIEISFHNQISREKYRRYVPTGQKLHADDIIKSRIKQANRTKSLRQIVDKKHQEVVDHLRNLQYDFGEVTPEIYDQSIVENEYIRSTIFELYDTFLKYQERKFEPLTVKKQKTLKNLLLEYCSSKNLKTLYLHDINLKFYDDFSTFLEQTKNHSKSTISKYQASLKTFMQFLTDKMELNKEEIHKNFKRESTRTTGGSTVVLLKEHIDKLKKWKTNNERYDLVRDLFLFQILTGVRYSDLVNINKSYVINNSLSFDMYKVNQRVTIPLHLHAKKILIKYDYKLGERCKTLQNYNKDIKEVCRLAGLTDKIKTLKIKLNKKVNEDDELWQLVSTHVGRTTFITNCLIAGISPFIVKDYTGHTSIDTLSVYVRMAGSVHTDAFTKFQNYLNI